MAIDGADAVSQFRNDLGAGEEFGVCNLGATGSHLAAAEGFGIGEEQSPDARLPFRHHQGLIDQTGAVPVRAGESLLDRRGCDVFAVGGLEQLLHPAGDGEVAIAIEGAHIPGVQPALGIDRRDRLAVVAAHDARPAGEDLSRDFALRWISEPDLDSGEGLADRAQPACARMVDGDHWRRFGQAVAGIDRQIDSDQEPRQFVGQGRTTDDQVFQAPTQGLAQFGVDQPIGDAQGPRVGTALFAHGRRAGHRQLQRPAPQLAFDRDAVRDLRPDPQMDLLDQPRHGGHHRRLDFAQQGADLLHIIRDQHRHALDQVRVDHHALEHMGERQAGQRPVASGLQREQPRSRPDLAQEVCVGQFDAFGQTGRTAGMDDGGEIVGSHARQQAHEQPGIDRRKTVAEGQGIMPGMDPSLGSHRDAAHDHRPEELHLGLDQAPTSLTQHDHRAGSGVADGMPEVLARHGREQRN